MELIMAALVPMVQDHGVDAVLKCLARICRTASHSAKYEKQDFQLSEKWQQVWEELVKVAAEIPGSAAKEEGVRCEK
jgi:hypothetical protein